MNKNPMYAPLNSNKMENQNLDLPTSPLEQALINKRKDIARKKGALNQDTTDAFGNPVSSEEDDQ